MFDTIVVGGGAAGFFTALNLVSLMPKSKVAILERGQEVLTKVKISGGGRCNVTHAEFDPSALIPHYPRGQKELLGPFHTFMTGDTMAWFEARGVRLKIEDDGRVFPESNSAQTIIDCFLSEAKRLGIAIHKGYSLQKLSKDKGAWIAHTSQGDLSAKHLVITTGSNPKIWQLMSQLGHQIIPAVPSLFTFNCKDQRIQTLPGLTAHAAIRVVGTALQSQGPLLITHWGLSGPAILKLSAWGARKLHQLGYRFDVQINWLQDCSTTAAMDLLKVLRTKHAPQQIGKYTQLGIPKRLWQNLLIASGIPLATRWAEGTNKKLGVLAAQLTQGVYAVAGKSTFKEEFVTAGGIDLREVDFRTFSSKKQEDLYFAGEVLNIDGVTGGFNFQNAWTGGYMIARAIAAKLN